MSWQRQPQETTGDYFFTGRFLLTQGVQAALSPTEVLEIVQDLIEAVRQNAGLDYLQVYRHSDGRVVWCICQLSRSMKTSGEYTEAQLVEYDYWTMLLPEEY